MNQVWAAERHMEKVLTFSLVFGPFLLGFQVCLIPEIPELLPLFPCNLLEKQARPHCISSSLFPSCPPPSSQNHLCLFPSAMTSGVCGEHLPPPGVSSGIYYMEESRIQGENCFLLLMFSSSVWEEHPDLCLFFFASWASGSRSWESNALTIF